MTATADGASAPAALACNDVPPARIARGRAAETHKPTRAARARCAGPAVNIKMGNSRSWIRWPGDGSGGDDCRSADSFGTGPSYLVWDGVRVFRHGLRARVSITYLRALTYAHLPPRTYLRRHLRGSDLGLFITFHDGA